MNETTQPAVAGPVEPTVMQHCLPESFVTEGLKLAEGTRLFGKRFSDMTRDELIAAATQGWAAERRAREQYAETSAARAAFFVEQARFWKGDRAA